MYNFTSSLKAHDLVRALVKFLQRLALVLMELVLEECLRSYPRDCCHHCSILLGIVNRGQLVIETLYASLHVSFSPYLILAKRLRGVAYLHASWN